MTNPHGGKRAGAGRPAHDEKPIPVTVTLPPSIIAKLKKIDPNLSAAIRSLVEQSQVEQLLALLTDEQRLDVFRPWCAECGGAAPCQCWNDE